MDSELGKARTLLAYVESAPLRGRPHLVQALAPIRQDEPRPSRLVQRVKWITAAVGLRSNPVLGLLLNALLPWDAIFALLAGRVRSTLADRLPAWLEALYRLEAVSGLANFADLNPDYTYPQVEAGRAPVFAADGLGHPLLPPDQKVSNDFMLDQRGQVVIITGSNMAGKSTFLKTIGVNLCLAYAGGPVDARRLQIIPFRLHTCMRISDSLTDGFSYFYAEVRCLRRLLERIQADGYPLLYLVDEIFRGTNNRERLIGSRAYIQALAGTAGVGFLATHDLELASLAEEYPQVTNFHFRERVEARQLIFDYRLRPGPCPTTNALTIMEMEGLPVGREHWQENEARAEGG
jgi:DNA mismatch repair ATPase MutS